MARIPHTQLQQIGLRAVPATLDDFLARVTKSRWSPHVLLEQLAHPSPDRYVEYLRLKLHQLAEAKGMPSKVQKNTFSDDR